LELKRLIAQALVDEGTVTDKAALDSIAKVFSCGYERGFQLGLRWVDVFRPCGPWLDPEVYPWL
jgi:hypothetical protein